MALNVNAQDGNCGTVIGLFRDEMGVKNGHEKHVLHRSETYLSPMQRSMCWITLPDIQNTFFIPKGYTDQGLPSLLFLHLMIYNHTNFDAHVKKDCGCFWRLYGYRCR